MVAKDKEYIKTLESHVEQLESKLDFLSTELRYVEHTRNILNVYSIGLNKDASLNEHICYSKPDLVYKLQKYITNKQLNFLNIRCFAFRRPSILGKQDPIQDSTFWANSATEWSVARDFGITCKLVWSLGVLRKENEWFNTSKAIRTNRPITLNTKFVLPTKYNNITRINHE